MKEKEVNHLVFQSNLLTQCSNNHANEKQNYPDHKSQNEAFNWHPLQEHFHAATVIGKTNDKIREGKEEETERFDSQK